MAVDTAFKRFTMMRFGSAPGVHPYPNSGSNRLVRYSWLGLYFGVGGILSLTRLGSPLASGDVTSVFANLGDPVTVSSFLWENTGDAALTLSWTTFTGMVTTSSFQPPLRYVPVTLNPGDTYSFNLSTASGGTRTGPVAGGARFTHDGSNGPYFDVNVLITVLEGTTTGYANWVDDDGNGEWANSADALGSPDSAGASYGLAVAGRGTGLKLGTFTMADLIPDNAVIAYCNVAVTHKYTHALSDPGEGLLHRGFTISGAAVGRQDFSHTVIDDDFAEVTFEHTTINAVPFNPAMFNDGTIGVQFAAFGVGTFESGQGSMQIDAVQLTVGWYTRQGGTAFGRGMGMSLDIAGPRPGTSVDL